MKRILIPGREKDKLIWVSYFLINEWWESPEIIAELDTRYSVN